MLQRFCLLLVFLGILIPARAQSAPAAQPVLRYHFGDNPAWAAPSFNDNAWPIAKNGAWPLPPLRSSGFVWVRMQIPVPPASTKNLAAMLHSARFSSQQVYLQGALIGQSGQLPPHPVAVVQPLTNVFPVPSGLAAAPVATIALRIWYPHDQRYVGREDHGSVHLGSAPLLQSEQRANHLSGILSNLPALLLPALLGLVGVGLFFLWYWSRRRELLWFSLLLITHSIEPLPIALHIFLPHPLPFRIYVLANLIPSCVGMPAVVEFLRTVFHIRARWFRIILHLAWMIFLGASFVGSFGLSQTSSLVAVAVFLHVATFALIIFNYGTLLTNLRYLISGPNRAIAFGMFLMPLGSLTGHLGIQLSFFHISLFFIGFILVGFAISALLIRRAISAWRQGDRLKGEIDAAHEIQQRLVPLELPTAPGCHIEAVYLPAAEVGGDFYQCRILPDGTQRVLVGDVSGKGAAAAMTGAVLIGASEGREADSPFRLLHHLNHALLKNQIAGFVTCLCAHISPNGTLTVANAGHLSPYRNGEEIPLESGLPLGITEAAEYSEKTLQLSPGDQLTFMSDGVIEARNPQGELYGFDRTRQISTQTAQQIANAASTFGQEDDITVLTLTYAGSTA